MDIDDIPKFIPEGHSLRGVSTYYDKNGDVIGQWVKTQTDRETQEALLKAAAQAFIGSVPRAKPISPPKSTLDDLANLYLITDYHLGMMAWHEESGENWDVKIAESLIMRWFSSAIKKSPNAKVGIFAQLGDFLHWDGLDAVTPTGKHLLDADTRFQNIVRIAIRVLRGIVQILLKKHEIVHIIMAEGNHDPASSVWLREMFCAFYDNEPRVIVDQGAGVYHVFEHGDTSLFFHHGHKRKPKDIDNVLAGKYRDIFGRTKHSYAHLGHMHHIDTKETNLMIVEQHRTLSASDAYAARLGFSAGRDAKVITYHKRYGEVSRITLSPEMVKEGK